LKKKTQKTYIKETYVHKNQTLSSLFFFLFSTIIFIKQFIKITLSDEFNVVKNSRSFSHVLLLRMFSISSAAPDFFAATPKELEYRWRALHCSGVKKKMMKG